VKAPGALPEASEVLAAAAPTATIGRESFPWLQPTAASNRRWPSQLRLAAAASEANHPPRRAGAFMPTMAAPAP
jgi:hypothetical protein